MKETSRGLVWTGELPDHVVDLQADDFHDKGTRLQDTRLRIGDKHESWLFVRQLQIKVIS